MRIGIIGAGAIGCLVGALLARAGNEVTLVHRRPSVVRKIRRKGVILHQGKRTLRVSVHAGQSPANLSDSQLVVFAVKAYDTSAAARSHRHLISRNAPVLSLQNGLGNVEILSRVLSHRPVLGGATTEASLLLDAAEIVHTGRGVTWIGEYTNTMWNKCESIAREFRRAQIDTRVSVNIRGVIWSKTIVNSAVNPVSALTGLRNGMLPRSPGLMDVMSRIIFEGIRVSTSEVISLAPTNPLKLLLRVLQATELNYSSMLQDVNRARRTEVSRLNGAIERLGEKHGVRTPINQLLAQMVTSTESPVAGTSDI